MSNETFYKKALNAVGVEYKKGNITQGLYKYAKTIIPAGTQLLSKRPEMFAPDQWPGYFSKAKGCEIWDIDGKHYYDMSISAIGANLLGYADPDVSEAVKKSVDNCSMASLNAPEEVELTDRLCEIHPWAQQGRLARTGGSAAMIAVRIARSTTQRSMVAICGYHGCHDWYLASNLGDSASLDGHLMQGLNPRGVPRELQGTTVTFRYNNLEQFQEVIKKHGDKLAAVIMEPARSHDPDPGFLEAVRDGAHKCGALLIFDEITIGFRLCYGGAHLKFGVNPDMAVFGKALGSGHPISAVIGTREAMYGANVSFLSSSFWTESIGPVAAVATLNKMEKMDVPGIIAKVGQTVTGYWQKAAEKHGLKIKAGYSYPCLAAFAFEHELANELKTLYIQLMLERGILASMTLYCTAAHTDEIVAIYGKAIDEVFGEIADAIAKDQIKKRLKGPAAHVGFTRLI